MAIERDALHLIGQGQSALVFRVLDPESDSLVALKCPRDGPEPGEEPRLEREFRLLKALSLPGFVRPGHLLPGGRGFTLELLSRVTLAERQAAWGSDSRTLGTLFAACLLAAGRLHRLGFVHGDLKPSAIHLKMRSREGDGNGAAGDGASTPTDLPTVTIADLGLAKRIDAPVCSTLEGTPQYMAPELIRGEGAGPRSDLYALGVTFLEALTGFLPHAEEGVEAVLAHHLEKELADTVRVPGWTRVLAGLLARDPNARFADTSQALATVLHEGLLKAADLRALARSSLNDEPAWIARGSIDEMLDDFVATRKKGTGRHLRIVGPEKSGRSRTLRELATRWELAGGLVLSVSGSPARPLEESVDAAARRLRVLLEGTGTDFGNGGLLEWLTGPSRPAVPVLVAVDGAIEDHDLSRLRQRVLLRGGSASWAWVSSKRAGDGARERCIELPRWTPEHLAKLFEGICGWPCEEPSIAPWIDTQSLGRPGLAVSAVHSLLASAAADFSPSGWTIDAGRLAQVETDRTAEAWARQGLERVAPADRTVLEALALLGGSREETLAAIVHLEPRTLRRELDGLREFLRRDGGFYWVENETIARTIREEIVPGRRRAMALRARSVLEQHQDEDRWGFRRAMLAADADLPEAPSELSDASARLVNAGQPVPALRCAERGLLLGPCPAIEADLLAARGQALLRLGRVNEAAAVARDLLDRPGLSAKQQCKCHRILGGAFGRLNRREEAVEAFRRVLALLPPKSPIERANVETEIGVYLTELGRLDEAEETLCRAADRLADRSDALRERTRIERALALLARKKGDWAEAKRRFLHSLECSTELGQAHEVVADCLNLASLLNHLADYEASEEYLAKAQQRLETDPHLGYLSTLWLLRAYAAAGRCDWTAALRAVRRARRGFRALARPEYEGSCLVLRAEILAESGEPRLAARTLRHTRVLDALRGFDRDARLRARFVRFFAAVSRGSDVARRRVAVAAQSEIEGEATPIEAARLAVLEGWHAHLEGDEQHLALLIHALDPPGAADEPSAHRMALEIAALAAAYGLDFAAAPLEIRQQRFQAMQRFVEALREWTPPGDEAKLLESLGALAELGLRQMHARCTELALTKARRLSDGSAELIERWRWRAGQAWSAAGGPARSWEMIGPLHSAMPARSHAGASDTSMKLLLAAADLLAVLDDPKSVPDAIVALAATTLRARRGILVLQDADGSLRNAAFYNADESLAADVLPISTTVVHGVLGEGASFVSRDAAADPWLKDRRSIVKYSVRSVVCSPVRRRGVTIGALYVDTNERPGAFGSAEAAVLERVGVLAAVALELASRRSSAEERVVRLGEEMRRLREASGLKASDSHLIYRSPVMERVVSRARQAASTDATILITGESGVGKNILASYIHQVSPRADGPFLTVDLPGLNASLIENELFGHEPGAFTGAARTTKLGLFEVARGGTLFLDEIGDLPMTAQAKLLRAVEERRGRRVGGTREIVYDIRLICATNRNLKTEIASGRFRGDLYARIAAIQIHIPPLRDRREDIAPLVTHYFRHFCQVHGRRLPPLPAWVVQRFENAPWDDWNVRDLLHAVESLVVFSEGENISEECLPPELETNDPGASGSKKFAKKRGELEKSLVLEALSKAEWNRTRAAKDLGVSPRMVRYLIRKYGLKIPPSPPGRRPKS